MPVGHEPLAEQLAEHAEFVRRLARGLLGDRDRAEDVAQEAALAALQTRPALGDARAWLARVGRRLAGRARRAEQRRAKRERVAARAERLPPADLDPAREELLGEVTAGVLALAEPYRGTVLRHFYEGWSPAQIAAADGVASATVHSRLRRALQQLRGRLDRRVPGGRSAWAVVAARFAGDGAGAAGLLGASGASAASAAVFTGVVAMSSKAKTALLAVALTASVAFMFVLATRGAAEPNTPPVAGRAPAATLQAGVEAPPVASIDRQAIAAAPPPPAASAPATPAPTTATVALVVTWQADGTPAAGRTFDLLAWGDAAPFRSERSARTDAEGRCEVPGLAPGLIAIYGDVGGGGSVTVEAGEHREVTLAIPPGTEVRGRVVDAAGQGVASAAVWLSDYGNTDNGHLVATSAADGAFTLRGVGGGRQIAAFAAGHGPAPLQRVEGRPGEAIEITLQLGARGAVVFGAVRTPDGMPAAAEVRLERGAGGLEDPRLAPRLVRTDPAGGFRLDGVAPGTATLRVRAAGCAPWAVDVDLQPGEQRQQDVQLRREGRVFGTVRDGAGAPVAGAEVRHGEYARFATAFTKTNARGQFRLTGLPAGVVSVSATKDETGTATARLSLVAGVPQEWNPVLDAGRVLRVRLVGGEREPLIDWVVDAACLKPLPGTRRLWSEQTRSDENGGIRIAGCPDGDLRLEIRDPSYGRVPVRTVPDARADGAELVVEIGEDVLPTASLRGAVLDAAGRPPADGGSVRARRSGSRYAETADLDPATGRFDLPALAPGDYRLVVSTEGHPDETLATAVLVPRQVTDLGELRLTRAGAVQLAVDGVVGGFAPFERVLITPAEGRPVAELRAAPPAPEPLLPGRYQLIATGTGVAPVRVWVDVTAGVTATATLPAVAGIECRVRVRVEGPAGSEPPRLFAVVVRVAGEADAVVDQGAIFDQQEGPLELVRWLRPGSYEVEVVGRWFGQEREPWRGARRVVVGASGPTAVDIAVRAPE